MSHTERAFPVEYTEMDAKGERWQVKEYGLTKRELFAAMAMHGLVASTSQFFRKEDGKPVTERDIAKQAVVFADVLLEALSDEQQLKQEGV